MRCSVTDCNGDPALHNFECVCVPCARKMHQITWKSLLRPLGDNVVIFPDEHKSEGRIIVVSHTSNRKDRRGVKRREDDFATGVVLAVGPGVAERKSHHVDSMGRACAITFKGRKGEGVNEPVNAEVGQHVAFRYVYEAAIQEWRGLLVVHDFDILGVLEKEVA